MAEGPFEKFCDELEELINKWWSKPHDDRLTRAQVVGALEFVKHEILHEDDDE